MFERPNAVCDLDAVVEFETTVTVDDWLDFAPRNHRGYLAPRRPRGPLTGLAAILLAFPAGALPGWATGGRPPRTLGDILLVGAPASTRGSVLPWLALAVRRGLESVSGAG